MRVAFDVALDLFGVDGFQGSGTTYRKELIYESQFIKKDSRNDEGLSFRISAATIQHFVNVQNELLEAGVEVPVPLGHTTDPRAKQGKVVRFERGRDSKGRDALFGIVEFKDQPTADLLKDSNISVYIQDSYTLSTTGKLYTDVISHAAITDYPVVPGMDSFEPTQSIAASYFVDKNLPKEKEKDKPMSVKTIAESLGLEVITDETEEDMEKRIQAKLKEQQDALDAAKKPVEKPVEKKEEQAASVPIAAGFISMARDARQTKLQLLLDKGLIESHEYKAHEARYCSDEALQLSLSNDGTASDDFDHMVAIAAKRTPSKLLAEKSGLQSGDVIALSNDDGPALSAEDYADPELNPLVKDMKARGERYKKQEQQFAATS